MESEFSLGKGPPVISEDRTAHNSSRPQGASTASVEIPVRHLLIIYAFGVGLRERNVNTTLLRVYGMLCTSIWPKCLNTQMNESRDGPSTRRLGHINIMYVCLFRLTPRCRMPYTFMPSSMRLDSSDRGASPFGSISCIPSMRAAQVSYHDAVAWRSLTVTLTVQCTGKHGLVLHNFQSLYPPR